MAPDDAARNLFISRGGDPRPGSLVSHRSGIIQECTTTLPLLYHRKKKRRKSKYASPPSCTISLNIECALFLCHLEILLTYHRKAGGSILNKQCYPISQKMVHWSLCAWSELNSFIYLFSLSPSPSARCDIWTDCISAWGEWRKEPFINHSLTLLLHYPKLVFFSLPLSVSHQNSIIPVKAVWIVG